MSLPVQVVPSLDGASIGSVVEVDGAEAHHAVAVRRLGVGVGVVLTDGRGASVTGRVEETGKRWFSVSVTSREVAERPQPSVTVVQALPKGDRGELAVEVLTEIGVDEIVPWAAARCVAAWRRDRAGRSHAKWAATAREAAKQARRAWFPMVPELASTESVVRRLADADLAVVLHEGATSRCPRWRSRRPARSWWWSGPRAASRPRN